MILEVTEVLRVEGDGGARPSWASSIEAVGGEDETPFEGAALGSCKGSREGESLILPRDWFRRWFRDAFVSTRLCNASTLVASCEWSTCIFFNVAKISERTASLPALVAPEDAMIDRATEKARCKVAIGASSALDLLNLMSSSKCSKAKKRRSVRSKTAGVRQFTIMCRLWTSRKENLIPCKRKVKDIGCGQIFPQNNIKIYIRSNCQ